MNISALIFRIVSCYRRQRRIQMCMRAMACAILATVLSPPLLAANTNTIVRIETNVGGFNVELYNTDVRLTVDNFLGYVNRNDYDNSVIHRHATLKTDGVAVIQGGGYAYQGNLFGTPLLLDFPKQPPIINEYLHPNRRGTIAMAKKPPFDSLGNPVPDGGPDSATSEWFINLDDSNATTLDSSNNGGFTVFGEVLGSGMNVVDTIANVATADTMVQVTKLNPDNTNQSTYKIFPRFPIENGNVVIVNNICINDDADSVCNETEDLAPGGDGNKDNIPDRNQANVTTFLTTLGHTATLSANDTMAFDNISTVNLGSTHFNNGMFTWKLSGTMGTAGVVVTLSDGAATRPDSYYAYGPTPDNPTPHWYDFTFDGETGAEISGDKIILHFVDGKRGDNDLVANSITHTGAQAVLATFTSAQEPQSGGCSITTKPSQGVDWILVSLFLTMLALVRRRAHRQTQQERVTNIASP